MVGLSVAVGVRPGRRNNHLRPVVDPRPAPLRAATTELNGGFPSGRTASHPCAAVRFMA